MEKFNIEVDYCGIFEKLLFLLDISTGKTIEGKHAIYSINTDNLPIDTINFIRDIRFLIYNAVAGFDRYANLLRMVCDIQDLAYCAKKYDGGDKEFVFASGDKIIINQNGSECV